MSAFSKPLIAVTLDEGDESLLRYSALLARWLGWSDVLAVHVVEQAAADAGWDPQPWRERMQTQVEQYFDTPTTQCRVECQAVAGARLDQLLATAAQQQRDLIVLGHRQGTTGRRSMACRLAMLAPCSVWLVPQGAAAQISNILVPTDFSEASGDALSVATKIAQAGGLSQVRAVHVFFDPSFARYEERVDEVLGQEEAAFRKFIGGANTHGVTVEPLFEESSQPAPAILRVAQGGAADLIVMSTRGRTPAASLLLGSTTAETLATTSVPLLAVKHYGDHLSVLQALLDRRSWEHGAPKTN
jgi:nucleotide-binding universal stress UspA family protein